jgi:hypothetical protein
VPDLEVLGEAERAAGVGAFDELVGALPLDCRVVVGGFGPERVGGVADVVFDAVARDAPKRLLPVFAARAGGSLAEQRGGPRWRC